LPAIPSVASGTSDNALTAVMYARYCRVNCGSYGMFRKTDFLIFVTASRRHQVLVTDESVLPGCGLRPARNRPAGRWLARPCFPRLHGAGRPSLKIDADHGKNLASSRLRHSESLRSLSQSQRLEIEFHGAWHRFTSSRLPLILTRSFLGCYEQCRHARIGGAGSSVAALWPYNAGLTMLSCES